MRPTLYFDADCGFCLYWVDYWKHLTGDRIDYRPGQNLAAVRLETTEGETFHGAAAVFRSLADTPWRRWLWKAYKKLPGFAIISESAYRWIARHRGVAFAASKLIWGKIHRPPKHFFVRALFLKSLGLIYLFAFWSWGLQVAGLIGSSGILPAEIFLVRIAEQLGNGAFWQAPSIFWLTGASDAILQIASVAGVIFSLFLILGILPRASLITLFILYLSFASVGQVFMQFQWDTLLPEVGFLAIIFSFSTAVVWLFRWLIFRFIFLSGFVKLASGDLAWKNLTALNYHFETQPLPTAFAWFFHNLPSGLLKSATIGMFIVELAVPFLIFFPRRFRFLAAVGIAGLEILIFFTGNYNFFNILTISLCLLLLDDAAVERIIPKKFFAFVKVLPNKIYPVFGRSLIAVITGLILLTSAVQLIGVVFRGFPEVTSFISRSISPFRIVNTYGLFAVMTKERNEIILEGSDDGEIWREYKFKYKPGDLAETPRWAAPHQPRLDWQMWFAALGNFQRSPWFISFVQRILEGSKPVLGLLEENPFPNRPPRFARALIYNYKFTGAEERKDTGAWWKRDLIGLYFPVVELQR